MLMYQQVSSLAATSNGILYETASTSGTPKQLAFSARRPEHGPIQVVGRIQFLFLVVRLRSLHPPGLSARGCLSFDKLNQLSSFLESPTGSEMLPVLKTPPPSPPAAFLGLQREKSHCF